ncbi:hypothetical protein Leryth_012926 [Lithospermum erythrorhizon]|nr:hypothetical protein Leryth_012926 [Lithospermum erythrorhizon]
MVVCTFNLFIALYILKSEFTSFFDYTYTESQTDSKYTDDQIRNMEESIRIRKALKPTHLIRLVKQMKTEFVGNDRAIELPEQMKKMITNELLMRLRTMQANAEMSMQQETVESWRVEKLREAEGVIRKKTSNSSISIEEADVLINALGSDWPTFSEEFGFWVPVEVDNTGYVDLPEGSEKLVKEIIPRSRLPPECKAELHTDYGGVAVTWGLTHRKESPYECCMACLEHARNTKPGKQKCNIWVYCPSTNGCHSPDVYEHELGECWLKYSEKPRLNFKNEYPESYRKLHPNAPLEVPWMSGFITD